MKEVNQNPTVDSLRDYRRGVETLMKLKSPKLISNSEPSHAAILFEAFFNSAQNKVRIFCKNLNAEVFGNDFVLLAAKRAVEDRHIALEILIQDESPQPSPFSEWALTGNNSNVSVATVHPSAKDSTINFSVMDETAFRFEEDRNECSAVASMNFPNLAKIFARKFDLFLKSASALAPAVS